VAHRIGSRRNQKFRRLFLREWREARGLTQARLLERIREREPTFSDATLSRLENGKQPYTQPVLETLAAGPYHAPPGQRDMDNLGHAAGA
jgi:transcriptional regulator with XRE-family HTH domain